MLYVGIFEIGTDKLIDKIEVGERHANRRTCGTWCKYQLES